MNDVSLQVGENIYRGWTSVHIKRSLFCASGSFDLTLSDQTNSKDNSLKIKAGDACSVSINLSGHLSGEISGRHQPVITGYIDQVSRSFDGSSRVTTIAGRDKMMDVIDSSAMLKQKSWKNTNLLGLVSDLLSPFDIEPILEVSGHPTLPYHVLHEGSESAWEFIERAARLCSLICHSDGLGNLIITTPFKNQSKPRFKLVQGQNILSAHAQSDWSTRFSQYYVESTPYHPDDSESDASDVLPLRVHILDPEIKRHRPLMIVAEALGTPTLLKKRAQWEKAVRRGRSEKVTVELSGWRRLNELWNINEWVSLKSDWLGINKDYLITEVAFVMGVMNAQRTLLELQPANAFLADETLRFQQLAKVHEEETHD